MFGKRKEMFSGIHPPLKIMLIGDSMVGKSAICKSYIQKTPYLAYRPTISETHEVTVSIFKRDYEVILWDTSGVEEWDKLRRLDYGNTDCYILCYAINNKTSFDNVQDKWSQELRLFSPNVPILLVGAKSDIRTPSNRWISTDEGRTLKDRIQASGFIECSAKSIASIEGVLIQAVTIALRQRQRRGNVNANNESSRFSRCEVL